MEVQNLAGLRAKYHNGKGISPEELAIKASLSISTIYRMERGQRCGRNSVKRVAEVLKVSEKELTKVEVAL